MMCFALFVHVMTRWDPTAQLDRDDPFEMVLKTCHHLRAEGMSQSALLVMHAARKEADVRKQLCIRLRESPTSTTAGRCMQRRSVWKNTIAPQKLLEPSRTF